MTGKEETKRTVERLEFESTHICNSERPFLTKPTTEFSGINDLLTSISIDVKENGNKDHPSR